ncbi:MAG: PAS domain S-box protein, partial [Anaerolineae bacterium]|nr:PAS domain S-box protein [Anaerolineae bacterium]
MAGTVYFELMLAALSLIIASSIIVSGIWLRAFRTTRSLLALNLIIAVCASACIGSILAIDPGMKRFLGSFQIIVGAVGTALFFFAFDFCFPQRKIPLAIKILMILVPVATLVLALTDQYHTLMRNGYFWIIQGRLYRYLPSTIGPWIWVDTIYGSVLYLISAGLLAFTLARTPAIYRRQVIMILTGLTAPLFLLVLVASKDMQFYQVGFNLIFIVIADIFLTWGVFTKQLASILPFSRDLVFRTTTEALLVVDRDLRILDANRTAIQILERSPESLATLSLSEVFSFDQQKLELQAQSNVDIALSQTITFRDRYLLLFFSRINDSRQAMVGWLVTLHDFTEQRRLENALAESELKYRNVADNADEGILIIQDGMVVYANQHMLTMAGYEHDEIINTPFLTYVAHHYRQRLAEQYADRIAGKPVANLYEAELLDKQGGMVEVEISANRIEYNRQPAVVAFVRDIQARKCTERELNRIQNRFRKFVEQSQDGFIIIDQEGRIVEWNEAMERITQMPRNLAQGQVITRIVPAMNLTMMAGAVNEAASGLQEAIIDTETGDRRIVQYLVSAIQTGEEDQYGIVVRDITALKRAEYELFDSEQRFQRLADATPVLIWIIDSSGCCQYVNKATVEFAGKPAEVLLERGWASGINPDDMVMIDAIIHNPGDTDASTTHEIRAMRHDGEQRWLLCTAVRREDLAGIPIGFICSAVDITDQKMRETDLRKLSRAIEQSPAAVVITDLEGQIEYVNPRFHEMTGYELEDVRGQNPRILKSGEMPAQHYQAMWKAIRNGETWQGVFHNKKKNGDLYWDQTTISGITDLQGQLTHFLATKVDITAQRQAEEEARRMKQRMERIFNNPLVGIGLTNRQGRYNLVNQRYAEMLGYTTDELLQENVFRISSDDFVEATEDFFSSLMA